MVISILEIECSDTPSWCLQEKCCGSNAEENCILNSGMKAASAFDEECQRALL